MNRIMETRNITRITKEGHVTTCNMGGEPSTIVVAKYARKVPSTTDLPL